LRALAELPARIYQRQPRLWDRVSLSAGWSLLYLVASGMGVWATPLTGAGGAAESAPSVTSAFPGEWRLVLAALVFVLGVWRPVAGYAAFVVAVAYPLYLVSIYVMALALAVLVLLLPVMAAHAEQGVLFLTLLVFVTPLLAREGMAPLAPLLIGLWWQGSACWIGGGAAALWLKIVAGLTGHSVDLWQTNGWSMSGQAVYERFHAAGSLQTVLRVLEPLGLRLRRVPLARGIELGAEVQYPVSAGMFVLYNLLQVLAWSAVAWTVSAALDRMQAQGMGRGWGWGLSALSLGPGLLLVWAGYVAIPLWLQIEGPGWLEPRWLPLHILWVGVAAWLLDGLLRALHRPVSPPYLEQQGELEPAAVFTRRTRPWWAVWRRTPPPDREPAALPDWRQAAGTETAPHRPSGPLGRMRRRSTTPRPAPANDRASDIMIELD
jgi:hypothetical protein